MFLRTKWIIPVFIALCIFQTKMSLASFSFENVCTSEEKWAVDIKDKSIAELFSKAPDSIEAAYGRLQRLINFKAPQNFEFDQQQLIYMTHYWIWRSFLQLGLIHLADEGFSQLALQANLPQVAMARAAALSCVYQLHQRYPSLPFSNNLKTTLETLSLSAIPVPSVRAQTISLAGNILFQDTNRFIDPNFTAIRTLASSSEPITQLISGVERAKQEDYNEATKKLDAFVHSKNIPASWKKYKDMAQLILGQILSDQGQPQVAAKELETIQGTSNWFSDAQIARSWIYIQNGEYSKALGAAYHFHLASYKNRFAPEPLVTAAIAFAETCHYPEAWQSLVLFNRNYRPLLTWLKSNNLDHLYATLLTSMKNPKAVPSRIVAEWVASPIFTTGQNELNLIIDEQNRIKKMEQTLAHYETSADKARYVRLIATIRDLTKNVESDLKRHEARVITRIDEDLKERTQGMISRLETLQDNAQYIEIEVTNGGGEDLLKATTELAKNGEKSPQVEAESQQKKTKSPNYQWGRRVAFNRENQEVWIDELGLFQATLQNECQN